jgi:hypothetical protein
VGLANLQIPAGITQNQGESPPGQPQAGQPPSVIKFKITIRPHAIVNSPPRTSVPTTSETSVPTTSETSVPTTSETSVPTTSETSVPTSVPTTSETSLPTSIETPPPETQGSEANAVNDAFNLVADAIAIASVAIGGKKVKKNSSRNKRGKKSRSSKNKSRP